MKSRIAAILLSVTLLAPLALSAVPVAVQAEESLEDQEAKQDLSQVPDQNKEKTSEGEDSKKSSEKAEKDTDKDQKSEDETDADKDKKADVDKDKKADVKSDTDTDKDKQSGDETDADQDKKSGDETDADKDKKADGEDTAATKGEPEADPELQPTVDLTPEAPTDEVDEETLQAWAEYKSTEHSASLDDPISTEASLEIEEYDAENGIALYSNSSANSTAGENLYDSHPFEFQVYCGFEYDLKKLINGESSSTWLVYNLDDEQNQKIDEMPASDYDTMMKRLLRVLYVDYANQMYWYANHYAWVWNQEAKTLNLRLDVDKDYSTSGAYSEDGTIDADKVKAAQFAIRNADAIAAEAKDMDLYEALDYFKEKLLSLSTYNDDAAADGPDGKKNYGYSPWNIIYVFDLDPDTNVVCEGYSKAFKYLFDKWKVTSGSTANCYIISGCSGKYEDTEPYAKDGHMWNVLEYDGNRYLIDVTNSDKESTSYPDKVFLKEPDRYGLLGEDDTYAGRTSYAAYYQETNMKYWLYDVTTDSEGDTMYSHPMLEVYTEEQIGRPYSTMTSSRD